MVQERPEVHLANVGLPCDIEQEDLIPDARVISGVALLDVDWRVQQQHPALPLLPQPPAKSL